jgi:hypothetical protein
MGVPGAISRAPTPSDGHCVARFMLFTDPLPLRLLGTGTRAANPIPELALAVGG